MSCSFSHLLEAVLTFFAKSATDKVRETRTASCT